MAKISKNVRSFAKLAIALLFFKVLFSIVYEYRYYFPLDFEKSNFLIGRRESFRGFYPTAFYAHIFAGPLAVVLGAVQMASGRVVRFHALHRTIGRWQMLVIIVVGVSGLVMAGSAYTGPVAGLGFALLAVLTMFTGLSAAYHAIRGQLDAHRRWAGCCFVLLCSPLLLRIAGGIFSVTGFESTLTYQLNAWLSWLIPLVIVVVASNRRTCKQTKPRWRGGESYSTNWRAIR